MEWTNLHGMLLAQAFAKVLGNAPRGTMAFVRCLPRDVVEITMEDETFVVPGWKVWRVSGEGYTDGQTITADRAVEIREEKDEPVLLLVDSDYSGAGMDGVYSAGREVNEDSLFGEAQRLARREIARNRSKSHRDDSRKAIMMAQRRGGISQWAAFDYLCHVGANRISPGTGLYKIGLWPISDTHEFALDISQRFVDGLLGPAAASLPPVTRIAALRLESNSDDNIDQLERFLNLTDTQLFQDALEKLKDEKDLWIGPLRFASPTGFIEDIELLPWRSGTGKVYAWSGLTQGEDPEDPPALLLSRKRSKDRRFYGLEVRWKVKPVELEKNSAQYRIAVSTEHDEEIVSRDVLHSGRQNWEFCRFTDGDFENLEQDTRLPAKVTVEVIGNEKITQKETEEFVISFGEAMERGHSGIGVTVRTFSEGLAYLDNRDTVKRIASAPTEFITYNPKGFALLRAPFENGVKRAFRVVRPPLVAEIERFWVNEGGKIGRWVVKVRNSGQRVERVQFIPYNDETTSTFVRAADANKKMSQRFSAVGGVGQIYDDRAPAMDGIREYLRSWAQLLDDGNPLLALSHTAEIQSQSGSTIGLIVLPAHPLRLAWNMAYDNLVFHAAFNEKLKTADIRSEFHCLDGSMFPAFLPNPKGGTFVFADTLGFHTVAMVPDTDKEPKAALVVLARALGDGMSDDSLATGNTQSAQVLADEIKKYLNYHTTSHVLHIHALRAGDGYTVVRALGDVLKSGNVIREDLDEELYADDNIKPEMLFSLNLYPSHEQRGIAGRFISDAREKRRTGSGVLDIKDRWMSESINLPGGANRARLRWSRKSDEAPLISAHLSVAFDMFESYVVSDDVDRESFSKPHYAFGLLSFSDRNYTSRPVPIGTGTVLSASCGERHPSRPSHTDFLSQLQKVIQKTVSRHLGKPNGWPVFKTEIASSNVNKLNSIHRYCDWMITLDRNACVEYFDSPWDNQHIYDGFIVDAAPGREHLGCLQLLTSTTNLEEICYLLDNILLQIGLAKSDENAKFLVNNLKALSGGLAIRLTGNRPPTSDLVALALAYANCRNNAAMDECWVDLKNGFFVPMGDVEDLLPGFYESVNEIEKAVRPELIFVTLNARSNLTFNFIKVSYRQHLRTVSLTDSLEIIDKDVCKMQNEWKKQYSHDGPNTFRAIRRAKLARILRFFADKARRHYLTKARYCEIVVEIERMIERGRDYPLTSLQNTGRGWVFCPEYESSKPLKISPNNWPTKIFLFGPWILPDAQHSDVIEFENDWNDQNVVSTFSEEITRTRNENTDFLPKEQEDIDNGNDGSLVVSPSIFFGTDVYTGYKVDWKLRLEGNPHLLVAGLPGMGKTTCLVNLCRQMVDQNIQPLVFSYHQDIDDRLEEVVGNVRFVDFDALNFNPLRIVDQSTAMAYLDVSGAVRDIFSAIFPELGELQADRIRRAIKDSFEEMGWSASTVGSSEPEFGRFVEILKNDSRPDRGLRSLLARLGELYDYGFFRSSSVEQMPLWDSGRPTVIRIHKTQNENLQRAFSHLVFYGLYKDMFRRGVQKQVTHTLIFDEAHRATRLKLIPTMAKECRKYGISLVLASQEAKDFHPSVFSAIANYLVFRLTDSDARFLVRNVSDSKQAQVLMDQIKTMDRFKAFFFGEGEEKPNRLILSP